MKNNFILFISLITLLWFSSACKKQTDDTLPAPISQGYLSYFTAKIDGVPFSAKYYSAVKQSNGQIILTGSADDGRTIRLLIDTLSTGNRILKSNGVNEGMYGIASNQVFYSSSDIQTMNNGHIMVNNVSGMISGDFSFNAINLFNNSLTVVTDGLFSQIPYVDSASLVNPTGPISFFAGLNVQINGVLFNPGQVVAERMDSVIAILALRDNGTKTLAISVPADVIPGTYLIDPLASTANDFYFGYGENLTHYTPISGTITILSHNPTTHSLKGVFHAKTKDLVGTNIDLDFENGTFYVGYY